MAESRHETDGDLVRRIRRRDADALAAWVNRYADALYGFAFYRVNRDSDLAAEVTQETFTRALQQLDRFDPERGPMVSWLCSLSRNCIRDVLRERGHRPLAALWDSVDESLRRVYEEIDRSPLGPEVLEARETRGLVAMTLTNLPENYRDVLQARYVDDRTLEQIALERGTTIDAIKGLLKRARVAFKKTFAILGGTASRLEEAGG